MKNRIALITGGIGDIGTVTCQEFFRQGAKVIATDRPDYREKALQWQAEQKSLGFDFEIAFGDVTDFASCEVMAKDVESRVGPIDILINAAGTVQDAPFRRMTPEQWQSVVHTDLDSMFNVTRQFINGMIERGYGRIINISSVNAEKGQYGQTNYASAKSGVYGFTKSLAQEVAKHGVTVNAISPGYVEGKMIMTVAEPIREKIIAQIPLGRFAKPEEVARMVTFLADDASGFITGANIAINGGQYLS